MSWKTVFYFSVPVLIQMFLVGFYLGQENSIHFWDYAMYWNMAAGLFASGDFVWSLFKNSFTQNYNLLFAVPSFVAFWVFEPSRLVFILTNALVFVGFNQLALGLLLKRIFNLSTQKSVLFGFLGTWLIPPFWTPLLQGYPDHAAAASLCFAALFLLDRHKSYKKQIAAGLFLALAVILRRHIAYMGLAIIAASVLQDLFGLWKSRLKGLKPFIFQYAVIGFSALGLLGLIEPQYLLSMIVTDYSTLYAPYSRSALDVFVFVTSKCGLLLLAATLLGYAHIIKNRDVQFVGASFVIWLASWCFGPGHLGDHYLTAPIPLFVLVGLVGLYLNIKNKALRVGGVALLLGQTLFVFWPAASFPLPSESPQIKTLAHPRPPWKRQDIDELKRLARYIKETTSETDRVLIAGSSFIYSQDLVRALFVDHLHDYTTPLRFIPAPESDGQQEAPLDVFASANIYIVPNMPQYHLPKKGQRVITSLWEALQDKSGLFEKDPVSFKLMKGVTLSVIRRKNEWRAADLHKKLGAMRQIIDHGRPWIVIKGAPRTAYVPANHLIYGTLSSQNERSSLFYDKPLEKGRYELVTTIKHDPACQSPLVRLNLEGPRAQALYEKTYSLPQNPTMLHFPFSVLDKDGYISLSLIQQDQRRCAFALSRLVLMKKN